MGHNSKAVYRAYAKKAKVPVPSLEEFEAKATKDKVLRFPWLSDLGGTGPEGLARSNEQRTGYCDHCVKHRML